MFERLVENTNTTVILKNRFFLSHLVRFLTNQEPNNNSKLPLNENIHINYGFCEE